MNSPLEKAHELLDKFWLMDKVQPMPTKEQAKQCALIAVDEIINEIQFMAESDEGLPYWQEVRKEILSL